MDTACLAMCDGIIISQETEDTTAIIHFWLENTARQVILTVGTSPIQNLRQWCAAAAIGWRRKHVLERAIRQQIRGRRSNGHLRRVQNVIDCPLKISRD